jgi:hypothetical protein
LVRHSTSHTKFPLECLSQKKNSPSKKQHNNRLAATVFTHLKYLVLVNTTYCHILRLFRSANDSFESMNASADSSCSWSGIPRRIPNFPLNACRRKRIAHPRSSTTTG